MKAIGAHKVQEQSPTKMIDESVIQTELELSAIQDCNHVLIHDHPDGGHCHVK